MTHTTQVDAGAFTTLINIRRFIFTLSGIEFTVRTKELREQKALFDAACAQDVINLSPMLFSIVYIPYPEKTLIPANVVGTTERIHQCVRTVATL